MKNLKTLVVVLLTLVLLAGCTLKTGTDSSSQPETPDQPEPSEKGKLEIINQNHYLNSIESLIVLAEIKNTGQIAVKFPTVKVSWANDKGERKSDSWLTAVGYLEPGETTPFSVSLGGSAAEPNIELELVEFSEAIGYPKKTFEIVEQEGKEAGGYYVVNAKVKNTGSKDLKFVQMIITYYNAEGKPVEISKQPLYAFKAGETYSFSGTVIQSQPIKSYGFALTYDVLANKPE